MYICTDDDVSENKAKRVWKMLMFPFNIGACFFIFNLNWTWFVGFLTLFCLVRFASYCWFPFSIRIYMFSKSYYSIHYLYFIWFGQLGVSLYDYLVCFDKWIYIFVMLAKAHWHILFGSLSWIKHTFLSKTFIHFIIFKDIYRDVLSLYKPKVYWYLWLCALGQCQQP